MSTVFWVRRFLRVFAGARIPRRTFGIGSRDPNSGAHMARRYHELVPDLDVVDLPEIGHWLQLEAPGEVASAIAAHLRAHP